MIPTLLTEKQVSEILGVSKSTLQNWRFRGRGPTFTKIGRLCAYDQNDLEDYIQSAKRKSTSDRGEHERG